MAEHSQPDAGHALIIRRSRWVHAFIEVYPGLAQDLAQWAESTSTGQIDILSYMHLLTGRMLAKQFSDITEGRCARTTISGVPAIWSRLHLSAQEGIYSGQEMSGFRVTIAYGRAGLLVVALAPTASWQDFEPIALHIVRSIKFKPTRTRR